MPFALRSVNVARACDGFEAAKAWRGVSGAARAVFREVATRVRAYEHTYEDLTHQRPELAAITRLP